MPCQDRGIATDRIFTFNVTASDSLTDFTDVYWPLNHSSRMLAPFPKLKSLNVRGFVIQHTLLLLETAIFEKPALNSREAWSTDNDVGLGSVSELRAWGTPASVCHLPHVKHHHVGTLPELSEQGHINGPTLQQGLLGEGSTWQPMLTSIYCLQFLV